MLLTGKFPWYSKHVSLCLTLLKIILLLQLVIKLWKKCSVGFCLELIHVFKESIWFHVMKGDNVKIESQQYDQNYTIYATLQIMS